MGTYLTTYTATFPYRVGLRTLGKLAVELGEHRPAREPDIVNLDRFENSAGINHEAARPLEVVQPAALPP